MFIAFFVELGLLLIVLPWSAFWEQNYFAYAWPAVAPVFLNNFVRGAISGLGLVNLVVGVTEVISLFVTSDRSGTPLGGAADGDGESYTENQDARVEP